MTQPPQKKFLQDEQDPEINQRLQAAIRAVIDQQLAEGQPKETAETLERLLDEGFTLEQAYSLIGQLVSLEVGEYFAGTGEFNLERYILGLAELPAPFSTSPEPSEDD